MIKFKVVFIGAGNMTSEHAKAFVHYPEVLISGFTSKTMDKASKLAIEYKTKAYETITEMYEATKADVVIVSVPELATRKVLHECFKFPWKVLCEKPVGYDLDDAKNIFDEMTKSGREVYVALNRRHYGSVRTLLEKLQKQKGRRYIHIHDQEDQIAALKAGRPEAVVKNWMYANSIHMIDFFSFLGRGEITDVQRVIPYNWDKPDHVLVKISYSSGDVGIYEAVWNRPGPWFTVVTTDDARWEMRPIEQLACQVYGTRKLEPVPGSELDTQFKPGLSVQAGEMLKVLRGEKHVLPTLQEAMKTMELVSRIYS